MKPVLICMLFSLSFSAFGDCNESWSDMEGIQEIHDYKVVSKTYFHSGANDKYILRNFFLIPGDEFISYLKTSGFVFGGYTRKNGQIVSGWLKSETLVEITKPKNNPIPKLTAVDFLIYSPYGNIGLNDSYEGFYQKWGGCEINKQPDIGISGSFIPEGNVNYKYFDNYWRGFTIRSSNINYQQQGGDFDSYRITTITVNNKKYMTNRGVFIGKGVSDVIKSYGEPSKKNVNELMFLYNNYELRFHLVNNIVTSVVLDEKIQ